MSDEAKKASRIFRIIDEIVGDERVRSNLGLYTCGLTEESSVQSLLKIMSDNEKWFDHSYVKVNAPVRIKELYSVCLSQRIELRKYDILKTLLDM